VDVSEYHNFGIPAGDTSCFGRWISKFRRNLMLKFRGRTAFYPEDQIESSSEIRCAPNYVALQPRKQ